jgi:membrane associated rhomboid family serine protease
MSEVRMQAVKAGSMAGAGGVNHIAHLSGALMGVLLVFLVSKIPGMDA